MVVKGLIFTSGEFPQGSSAKRARILKKGFLAYDIDTNVIIGFPPLSKKDYNYLESNEIPLLSPLKESKNPQEKIKRRIFSFIFYKLYVSFKFLRFIKRFNPNFIVMGPDLIVNLVIGRYCEKRNIQLLIERLDENRRMYLNNKRFKDYLGILHDWSSDYVLKRKNVNLFVISEFLEKKYKTKYKDLKVHRAFTSMVDLVEFDKFSNNSLDQQLSPNILSSFETQKVKLCFAGSCVFANGLKFVLDCLAELKNLGINNFTYYMIFHKGYISEIREYVVDLGLENYCVIIEGVYPEYLPAIYKQCDILVLPEMGNVVANAGFPGKTAEYLASGKAIIATDFSDLSIHLRDNLNCKMSAIGDKTAYINNLTELINSDELRLNLGQSARKTAEVMFDYVSAIKPTVTLIYNNFNNI